MSISGPQGSASNEHLLARAERRNKVMVREEQNDLREILSLPAGRRVIWRLLDRGHVFSGIYATDSMGRCDTHYSIRREGERNLALWLMRKVQEAQPEGLMKVLNEGLTRDAQARREVIKAEKTKEASNE